jgi:hypothetical protein
MPATVTIEQDTAYSLPYAYERIAGERPLRNSGANPGRSRHCDPPARERGGKPGHRRPCRRVTARWSSLSAGADTRRVKVR